MRRCRHCGAPATRQLQTNTLTVEQDAQSGRELGRRTVAGELVDFCDRCPL